MMNETKGDMMVAGEQFLPENRAREYAEYLKNKTVEQEAEVNRLSIENAGMKGKYSYWATKSSKQSLEIIALKDKLERFKFSGIEKLSSSKYAIEVSLGNQIDSLRDELAGMRATIEANDATIESLRKQLSGK